MNSRRPSIAAAAGVALLLLSGCSLGGDDSEAASAPSTEVADASVEETAAASDSEPSADLAETVESVQDAAGEPTTEVVGELPVLATRAATSSRGAFEVDLNGVTVRDELMTVVFTVRVTELTGGVFSVGQQFDDGLTLDGPGGPTAFSTDGVYVLDNAEGTRHLAAYDSEDRCVCSASLSSSGVNEGGVIVLSTSFSSPPESTTTVDVSIPTVGVFTDVTVQR